MAPTARMTAIIANVQNTYNAVSSTTFDSNVITNYVNRGLQDVARKGYFLKETTIDVTLGETSVSLITGTTPPISDLLEVKAIWSADTNSSPQFIICQSYGELMEFQNQNSLSTSTTLKIGIMILNNMLYVQPEPTVTFTDALTVFHSYIPADVSIGGTPTDPPTPASFDEGLEFYVCYRQAMRDMNRQKADQRIITFKGLWDSAVRDLMSAGAGTDSTFQAARWGR